MAKTANQIAALFAEHVRRPAWEADASTLLTPRQADWLRDVARREAGRAAPAPDAVVQGRGLLGDGYAWTLFCVPGSPARLVLRVAKDPLVAPPPVVAAPSPVPAPPRPSPRPSVAAAPSPATISAPRQRVAGIPSVRDVEAWLAGQLTPARRS